MGCGCSSGGGNTSVANVANYSQNVKRSIPSTCDITRDVLIKWQNMLKCVKNSGNISAVGVAELAINQLLGIVQSALNYPDNYCYYSLQLNYFKDNILTKIVENVPECID